MRAASVQADVREVLLNLDLEMWCGNSLAIYGYLMPMFIFSTGRAGWYAKADWGPYVLSPEELDDELASYFKGL